MNQKNQPISADPKQDPFEVFFDGQCPLCKREIDMIRGKDKQNRLVLTDISAPEFQPEGRSLETMMKQIHGRKSDGEYVTGVQVFREIYQRLGFQKSVWFSQLFGVRHLLNLGYRFFAFLRFQHAKHRMNSTDCDSCRAN